MPAPRGYRGVGDDPRELRSRSANRIAAVTLALALLVIVLAVVAVG